MAPASIPTKKTARRRSNGSNTRKSRIHIQDKSPVEDRIKWVDYLTVLERINLVNMKIRSGNIRQHVASDVPYCIYSV